MTTVLAGVAAMVLNCAGGAKTSAATANNTETAAAAPQASTSTGTKIKYVAVVETEMDAQSGAAATLNPAEVRQITTVLRREAVKNLPRGKYNIMTSETVQSMGGAVLEECTDENCVITLGSKIGADYIVRGIISKFGHKFTVAVEMYETENGTLVASSDLISSESTAELLEKAAAASGEMYRTFENQQGGMSKQTVVATQQPVSQIPAPTPTPTNQQSNVDGSGTFTDSRDGKKYRTVVIGVKRWMAENLNYQPQSGKSWCYDGDNSNCNKYGRLYDWKTAKTVCPAGFHLPSRQEWNYLVEETGGNKAGKKLKARSGWKNNGNGTDDYGFSALPGGYRLTDGFFYDAGNYGRWWSATEGSSGLAYSRSMYYNYGRVNEYSYGKGGGLSVRCVEDMR